MTEDELKVAISQFFSSAHTKVMELSEKMFKEMKRVYYITPSNFIELVKGYVLLLKEKQDEFGNEIKKLTLGLKKLDEAGQKSEELK